MGILWPRQYVLWNGKHLDVDDHQTSVLKLLLQLVAGTNLISGLLECAVDFAVVLWECNVIKTAAF